jgi:hypothetical protein
VVIAFMVALAVMSLSFMGAGAVIAVPLSILVIAITGLVDLRRRARKAHSLDRVRQEAAEHGVKFTERDRETLVSE